MEIRKFIPVWVAILLLPMMVWSKGVSFSAARQVALNFCTSSGHPAGIAGSGDTTAYAALPQPGQVGPIPLYYRFLLSDGNGFVLVAADDRIPPILGYSFGPYLESESIPPAYSGFMMELERQITGIIKGSSIPGIETQRQWSSLSSPAAGTALPVRDLQPLIATNWNQGCFYNAGSPNDTAAKTSCLHALSGSGAVAMAQVMKFYNYPAHGSGEHGYVHPKYGIQYANFGATNYNYTLIPDTVSAPNDMAATLIYQCGVAQNMNFGVAGSTSDSSAVDTALVKYFSYPGTAAWKWKAGYTPGEWLSMIKSELDASHPLIYHGNSVGTGDSYFICDGYQGADFFHFNWGWGGAFDGYYYLDNLSPGSNNFASAQGAIFNLAPAAPVPDSYTMDFEAVPDFSLTFNNWTVNDVEKHTTYGIANHTFTHQYEPMAFLSFNPAQVTPSMASDAAIQPHGGVRFGACFNSNPPQNDDWFVSPQIQLGVNGSFSFWVKSYNDLYGLDTYTVAVSATDNNPGSFAVISGSQPLQTTLAWTKKTFSLSAYDNHKVYVAIHCSSNDHFLMMIDDLVVKTHGSTLLTAGFSASGTTVMAGDSINFLDQSVGVPTSWEWSFPGAIPAASVLQNPSGIRYPVPGIYPVKLKVSNGTNSDSITKTACINVSSYPSSMSLDFESLANFTLSFAPWTVIDVKGGNTYGIPGITFPNIYYPMSYICFNPAQTIPPLTIMQPHSGQKLGCCFSSVPSVPPLPATTPNDKWLISPKMSLGINARIEFWVKSYNTQYGNEMYNVSVSTTDLNPSSFVPLTTTPEASPADWTLRSYNLSAYTGQNVYIGIQCVTNDGFIFMLDDISITSTLGVDERPPLDRIMICPNPAGDHVTLKCGIKSQYGLRINLVSMLGDRIRSWNSADFSGTLTLDTHDIPGGMYILRIWDGTGKVDRKISIIN